MASVIGIPPLPSKANDIIKCRNLQKAYQHIGSQYALNVVRKVYEEQLKRSVKFIPSIFKNEEASVVELLVAQMVDKLRAGDNKLCEKYGVKWYGQEGCTKFFFDLDLKGFTQKQQAEIFLENKEEYQLLCYEHLQQVFNKYCQAPLEKGQVLFLWREGIRKVSVKNKNTGKDDIRWKVSIHIVVNGYKVRYVQLKPFMSLLKRKFEATWSDMYDLSIYSDQQWQLNCAWCRKDNNNDSTRLLPYPQVELSVENMQKYLITFLAGCKLIDLTKGIKKLNFELPSESRAVVSREPQGGGNRLQSYGKHFEYSLYNPNEVSDLFAILPPEVANDFAISIRLQYCAKVMGDQVGDTYKYLPDFVKFMQQKDYFARMTYQEAYEEIKENWFDKLNFAPVINLGYLRHIAQVFAPQDYGKISNVRMFSECDDIEIRDHIYSLFKGKSVFVNGVWYYYDEVDTMWKKTTGTPNNITDYITYQLAGYFRLKCQILEEVVEDIQDEYMKKIVQAKICAFQKICGKCRTFQFCDKVISSLQQRCEDNEFLSKFDMRLDCINFKNCYVCLEADKYKVYQRTINDYFTRSTGYDFVESVDSKYIERLISVLRQSYDNQEKFECLLDCSAYSLTGDRYLERFLNLFGAKGRNGKGLYDSVMSMTFGQVNGYYSSIEPSYFISNTNPQSQNEQELCLKYCRWVSITEPRRGKKINAEKIKKLTGNDTYNARGMYQTNQQFRPQGFIVFQSNQVLNLDNNGSSIESRRIDIDFPYEFKNCQADISDPETQKIGDPNLKNEFKDIAYAQAFMLFLLGRYYQKQFNKKAPIHIPEFVKETTIQQGMELTEDYLYVLQRICVFTNNLTDYVWHDDLRIAFNQFAGREVDTKDWKQFLEAPNPNFTFRGQRQNKPNKTKAHKVFKLRMKTALLSVLSGFEQFLVEIYQPKIATQKFVPISMYVIMKEYNQWLSESEEFQEFYITSANLRLLLGSENSFGDFRFERYNDSQGRDMFKITMAKPYQVSPDVQRARDQAGLA